MSEKEPFEVLEERKLPQMPLLKIKRFAQVTLPADIRKKLRLHEGDYLEAETRGNEIVLKPVILEKRERFTPPAETDLRERLKQGARKHAVRDLQMAQEAYPLEEELWQNQK